MDNRIIYLMRHAQVEQAEQRIIIGQLDVPLGREGEEQARGLRQMVSSIGVSTVYCSDLARSRRTAEIVADARMPVVPVAALREIAMGKWEGHTFADIARCFPEEFKQRGQDIGYYRVPGGESFADCGKRAVAGFHDIVGASRGNIIIVGHAGVNRLILSHVLGMPLANIFRLTQNYGCVNILQHGKSGYQVIAVNCQTTCLPEY
jgi:alpha-ribazole phosphatase